MDRQTQSKLRSSSRHERHDCGAITQENRETGVWFKEVSLPQMDLRRIWKLQGPAGRSWPSMGADNVMNVLAPALQ